VVFGKVVAFGGGERIGVGAGGTGEGGRSEMDGMETWDGAWREAFSGASTGDRARAASRLLGVCGVIGRTVVIYVRLRKEIVKRQRRHLSQVYMPGIVHSCIRYQGQRQKGTSGDERASLIDQRIHLYSVMTWQS